MNVPMSDGEYSLDAEFQALIPALSEDESAELRASVIADGCRDPLTVWLEAGLLVDGHNRRALCEELGIPYRVVLKSFDSREAVIVWMIRNQLGRRNITPFVRVEMALRLKDAIAAEAKKRQGHRSTWPGHGRPTNGGNEKPAETTSERIAGIAGVSHATVFSVEYVLKEGTEEIKAAARKGEISINRAYSQSKRVLSKKRMTELIRQYHLKPDVKFPCAVCGKYRAISEAHHIIPVYQLAELCSDHGVDALTVAFVPVRFVWLCPNHHAMFHKIEGGETDEGKADLLSELDSEEKERFSRLWDVQNTNEVFAFLERVRAGAFYDRA